MGANKPTESAAAFSLSLRRISWNAYVVGVGIGVHSWLVFLIVSKPLGMSTEISKFFGWYAGIFMGQEAMGKVRLPDVTGVPTIAWWVILIAIAGGAFYFIGKKSVPIPMKARGDLNSLLTQLDFNQL